MRRKQKAGSCRTCASPDRARIELMLANRVAGPKVAAQFGLSKDSVWRHWKRHVSPETKAALVMAGASDSKVDLERMKRVESESLLQNFIRERARLQRIADICESIKNYADAVRASAAVVRVIESTAKLLGELKVGRTTINQNFLLSPDWFQIRKLLATALRPHPAAQGAVLGALREYEAERGADVTHARAVEFKPPIEPEVA
jgi:hypothetical protein